MQVIDILSNIRDTSLSHLSVDAVADMGCVRIFEPSQPILISLMQTLERKLARLFSEGLWHIAISVCRYFSSVVICSKRIQILFLLFTAALTKEISEGK